MLNRIGCRVNTVHFIIYITLAHLSTIFNSSERWRFCAVSNEKQTCVLAYVWNTWNINVFAYRFNTIRLSIVSIWKCMLNGIAEIEKKKIENGSQFNWNRDKPNPCYQIQLILSIGCVMKQINVTQLILRGPTFNLWLSS